MSRADLAPPIPAEPITSEGLLLETSANAA